ncbi:MAG: periplasmic heavy metal sensor [Pseudomonadota bacterium]
MSKKTLGVILFVSLAFNFYFAGGELIHLLTPPPRGEMMPFDRVSAMVEKLPAAEKAEATRILESYRPTFDVQITRMKEARADLQATLKDEHYTREQGEKKFAAVKKQMDKVQVIMTNMLLDISEKLPPEDRVNLVPQRGKHGGGPRP